MALRERFIFLDDWKELLSQILPFESCGTLDPSYSLSQGRSFFISLGHNFGLLYEDILRAKMSSHHIQQYHQHWVGISHRKNRSETDSFATDRPENCVSTTLIQPCSKQSISAGSLSSLVDSNGPQSVDFASCAMIQDQLLTAIVRICLEYKVNYMQGILNIFLYLAYLRPCPFTNVHISLPFLRAFLQVTCFHLIQPQSCFDQTCSAQKLLCRCFHQLLEFHCPQIAFHLDRFLLNPYWNYDWFDSLGTQRFQYPHCWLWFHFYILSMRTARYPYMAASEALCLESDAKGNQKPESPSSHDFRLGKAHPEPISTLEQEHFCPQTFHTSRSTIFARSKIPHAQHPAQGSIINDEASSSPSFAMPYAHDSLEYQFVLLFVIGELANQRLKLLHRTPMEPAIDGVTYFRVVSGSWDALFLPSDAVFCTKASIFGDDTFIIDPVPSTNEKECEPKSPGQLSEPTLDLQQFSRMKTKIPKSSSLTYIQVIEGLLRQELTNIKKLTLHLIQLYATTPLLWILRLLNVAETTLSTSNMCETLKELCSHLHLVFFRSHASPNGFGTKCLSNCEHDLNRQSCNRRLSLDSSTAQIHSPHQGEQIHRLGSSPVSGYDPLMPSNIDMPSAQASSVEDETVAQMKTRCVTRFLMHHYGLVFNALKAHLPVATFELCYRRAKVLHEPLSPISVFSGYMNRTLIVALWSAQDLYQLFSEAAKQDATGLLHSLRLQCTNYLVDASLAFQEVFVCVFCHDNASDQSWQSPIVYTESSRPNSASQNKHFLDNNHSSVKVFSLCLCRTISSLIEWIHQLKSYQADQAWTVLGSLSENEGTSPQRANPLVDDVVQVESLSFTLSPLVHSHLRFLQNNLKRVLSCEELTFKFIPYLQTKPFKFTQPKWIRRVKLTATQAHKGSEKDKRDSGDPNFAVAAQETRYINLMKNIAQRFNRMIRFDLREDSDRSASAALSRKGLKEGSIQKHDPREASISPSQLEGAQMTEPVEHISEASLKSESRFSPPRIPFQTIKRGANDIDESAFSGVWQPKSALKRRCSEPSDSIKVHSRVFLYASDLNRVSVPALHLVPTNKLFLQKNTELLTSPSSRILHESTSLQVESCQKSSAQFKSAHLMRSVSYPSHVVVETHVESESTTARSPVPFVETSGPHNAIQITPGPAKLPDANVECSEPWRSSCHQSRSSLEVVRSSQPTSAISPDNLEAVSSSILLLSTRNTSETATESTKAVSLRHKPIEGLSIMRRRTKFDPLWDMRFHLGPSFGPSLLLPFMNQHVQLLMQIATPSPRMKLPVLPLDPAKTTPSRTGKKMPDPHKKHFTAL